MQLRLCSHRAVLSQMCQLSFLSQQLHDFEVSAVGDPVCARDPQREDDERRKTECGGSVSFTGSCYADCF